MYTTVLKKYGRILVGDNTNKGTELKSIKIP